MNIITISREFGSGGRELGRRLAGALGYDYYDREIIAEIAANRGLDENYVKDVLDDGAWRSIPLTFNQSFYGVAMQSVQVEVLLEQKHVIEEIAKVGNDCLIVGRNADIILEDYDPFKLFICADLESKIRRCRERAPEDEKLTDKELKRKIQRIDKNRAYTRNIITGSPWGEKSAYQLTVNTAQWDLRELAEAMGNFANNWFKRSGK